MADLWRFTNVWPPAVFGGYATLTFLSQGRVAAPRTLTKGGDDPGGHPEPTRTALGVPRLVSASPAAIHEL